MRHVAPTLFDSTLRRGTSLEQFLGGSQVSSERTIHWVEIRPGEDGLEVWEFNAPDEGNEEYLDVYGFLGDDEGELLGTFETSVEAISCAAGRGARPDRWVNESVIQDEYLDFVRAGRPAVWPSTVV